MSWKYRSKKQDDIPNWYRHYAHRKCPTSFVHSTPKEVHIDLPHFSRWHWVTDPDLGSCRFCQMVLKAICKRLLRPIYKIKMIRGWGRWPRDLRKLGWFSCALLMEKSVHVDTVDQVWISDVFANNFSNPLQMGVWERWYTQEHSENCRCPFTMLQQ